MARRFRITRKRFIIFLVIVGIALGIAFVLGVFDKEDKSQVFYSQLTGAKVSEEDSKRPILGVMIENSQEARPQTGLDSAGIVFEAVTEGGITRYLALYQENQPTEIGPVRSLRTHFLDWAMGFEASIAHVGGSPAALKEVKEREARSLNQFTYSQPYFRKSDRAAPHNMYARSADLRELQKKLGHDNSKFDQILRSDGKPAQDVKADNIAIGFSGPLFQVEFRYDKKTNSYTRYLGGQPHIDQATNKPITVKNVIVIRAIENGADIQAIGDGDALIFKDGNVIKAHWEQTDFDSRIQLTDTSEEGKEIRLNRGDSWFAVLSPAKSVKY